MMGFMTIVFVFNDPFVFCLNLLTSLFISHRF